MPFNHSTSSWDENEQAVLTQVAVLKHVSHLVIASGDVRSARKHEAFGGVGGGDPSFKLEMLARIGRVHDRVIVGGRCKVAAVDCAEAGQSRQV